LSAYSNCVDQDGKLDHILPVCDDDKCSIQVYDVSFLTLFVLFFIFFRRIVLFF